MRLFTSDKDLKHVFLKVIKSRLLKTISVTCLNILKKLWYSFSLISEHILGTWGLSKHSVASHLLGRCIQEIFCRSVLIFYFFCWFIWLTTLYLYILYHLPLVILPHFENSLCHPICERPDCSEYHTHKNEWITQICFFGSK